jgi:nitrile hydratase subunit beta
MVSRRPQAPGRKIASTFAPGDAVRVAARPALGHCRTPWYLRGKTGVVAAVHGAFRNPELLAYHRPGLPARTLYKVRFKQGDLWGRYAGPAGDHLEADIYEHWLEPLR